MPQKDVIMTIDRPWDFLEPAIDPNSARTIHVKLVAADEGETISYPAGQIVRQKDDGTNEFAKIGTEGYTGPVRLVKYPKIMDEDGRWQYGPTFHANGDIFENTTAEYYQGKFKTQDLVGLTEENLPSVGALISGNHEAGIIAIGAQGAQGPQGPQGDPGE